MPQAILGNHHTENCRVLPNRSELLYRLRSGGVAAEIGAAFGDFTPEIMEKNKPKQLHLIDAWDSERYREGLAKIKANFQSEISS